jgi:hypothetical protein
MSSVEAVAFFEKVTEETGHPSIVIWGPPVFSFKALWLPEAFSVTASSFEALAAEVQGLYDRLVKTGKITGRTKP